MSGGDEKLLFHSVQGEGDGELNVETGAILTVDKGKWLKGQVNGKTGFVPANAMVPIRK